MVPTPCIVCDMPIKTSHGIRRSRLYYEPSVSPGDEVDLEACATDIRGHFILPLTAMLASTHSVLPFECAFYGPGGLLFFASSSTGETAGSLAVPASYSDDDVDEAAEDVLPDECALIIQKRTGFGGRQSYGRLFISGLAEATQYAGEVAGEMVTAAKTLADKVPMDINVSGGPGPFTSVLHARHWNRKDAGLMPITKAYAIKGLGSRRDRRPNVGMTRL